METSARPQARPRHGGRTTLVLALAACLVGVVVAVRDDPARTTDADLERISDAVEQGCDEPSADLGSDTGFALDGVVLGVTVPSDSGAPVLVDLHVEEWFMGPPVDRTQVLLDRGTVRFLRTSGASLEPGLRLLVSGRGWGTGQGAPGASGCGRTRVWDAAGAADWRGDLPAAGPVGPLGPLARYPDAGFTRALADNAPGLTGVLLQDGGCLYVDDGVTRWLPVLPAGSSGWVDGPPQLSIGVDVVDAGHPVRLGGLPATGVVQRGTRPLRGAETRSEQVDEAGVPAGCRDDAPRFVVAEPPESGPATVIEVSGDDPLVRAVLDGATQGGLIPGTVVGQVRRDQFGAHSVRVAMQTDRAGEVLVHVENVAFLAWPFAYVPQDAEFRWSLNPDHRTRLPQAAPGTQLAVVERADGTTQLLLRTAERVVVSVSADPVTALGDPLAGPELLDALSEVARAVAVGRHTASP